MSLGKSVGWLSVCWTDRRFLPVALCAVVVFLVWVYLQAVILLYGVEFTAAYSRIRRGRADEAPAAPPLTP